MTEAAPAPELPDLVLNPDAVLGDEGVQWRNKRAPDYSKTRKFWAESTSPSTASARCPLELLFMPTNRGL